MKLDSRLSLKKRGGFLIMVGLVAYVTFSVAIALMTVDKCGGDDGAPKHWNVLPPEWQCEPRIARY